MSVMGDGDLRRHVALACRICYLEGHDHLFFGHVSVRSAIPGQVYIKPSGIGLEEVTPEQVALMDGEGNQIEGPLPPPDEAAIHLEIYRARADVNAVVHTHPLYATAASAGAPTAGIFSQDGLVYLGGLPLYPSSESVVTADLGRSLVKRLGMHPIILLRNHGLVAVGATVQDATINAILLERAMRTLAFARIFGATRPIPALSAKRMRSRVDARQPQRNEQLWRYLLRKLDRSPYALSIPVNH